MAASETWRTVSADIIIMVPHLNLFDFRPDRNFPLAEAPRKMRCGGGAPKHDSRLLLLMLGPWPDM